MKKLMLLLTLVACKPIIPEGCELQAVECDYGASFYDCSDENSQYFLIEIQGKFIEIHYDRNDLIINYAATEWINMVCPI